MHGNLKTILYNPFNRKYMKQFRNENDILNIVSAYCEEEEFFFFFFSFFIYLFIYLFIFAAYYVSKR